MTLRIVAGLRSSPESLGLTLADVTLDENAQQMTGAFAG
jgi:hypothetical protein